MRRAIPLGTLFALACVSIVIAAPSFAKVPVPTQMTPLADRYQRIYERVDRENAGPYENGVAGRNVADDGIFVKGAPPRPPTRAELQHGIDVMDRMLNPAPEPSASSSSGFVASAPATTSVAPSAAGGCPSSMAAESGSAGYGAVNPSSGAYGCYQILPSTAAAHGCDLSTPAGQDACAQTICGTEGSGAWAASGASPC